MHLITLIRLSCLACFVWAGGLSLAASTVVVLDPGHGGWDRGARWGGVSEKTITLSIAKRVERLLKARGIRTVMTRSSDRFVPLHVRSSIANRYPRSVLVSIHCNAAARRTARGIETFYAGSSGHRLARSIHRRLDARTTCPNRGIKFARFAVLRNTRGAAALVECGFLSCPAERRLLVSSAYQQRIAAAIADGIAAGIR